jgi:hypothetical protein
MLEPDRSQMTIWRMQLTCWINKAEDTHSEYVLLIAFPLQQRFHERPQCCVIRTIHYLSCFHIRVCGSRNVNIRCSSICSLSLAGQYRLI